MDRVAALLGLDREAVEPGRGVTLLPFLDGERTPNLPHSSGLLHGLRHDTTGGQLLQAAYDGAVYSLLAALDLVLDQDADPSAPLLLIGGGARGTAWQQTVRRLSGRPVQVPEAKELVALGAAAQAAGLLTGEDPAAVARRWGRRRGRCWTRWSGTRRPCPGWPGYSPTRPHCWSAPRATADAPAGAAPRRPPAGRRGCPPWSSAVVVRRMRTAPNRGLTEE